MGDHGHCTRGMRRGLFMGAPPPRAVRHVRGARGRCRGTTPSSHIQLVCDVRREPLRTPRRAPAAPHDVSSAPPTAPIEFKPLCICLPACTNQYTHCTVSKRTKHTCMHGMDQARVRTTTPPHCATGLLPKTTHSMAGVNVDCKKSVENVQEHHHRHS